MPHLHEHCCSHEELESVRLDYIVDLLPEIGFRREILEKKVEFPIQIGILAQFPLLS